VIEMSKYMGFRGAVRHLHDNRMPNRRSAASGAGATAGRLGAPSAERNGTLVAVRDAFADLPEHQRTLLILICVDGMSYKEAAEVLDVPLDVIASRMARARQALHEQIASHSPAGVAGMGVPPMSAGAGTATGEH
jgi:DNA-directed RNA polymerase specialized sigma24 family protein